MKKRTAVSAFLSLLLICMFLASCKTDDDEDDTYTVWTDVTTYSEFQAIFNRTLGDGYYLYLEFSNSEWKEYFSDLTSEGRHNWTRDKIKEWFIGRSFGNAEAEKMTSWLMTVDHGVIFSRTGSLVYGIMK